MFDLRTHATLLASFVTLATPVFSQERMIEISAGQWNYTVELSMPNVGVVDSKSQQFCVSEEGASLTFAEVLSEFNLDGCEISNDVVTLGSASIDFTCSNLDDGLRANGSMNGTYTSSAYDIVSDVLLTGPGGSSQVRLKGQGQRTGGC